MTIYLVKRLLAIIPTLLGITLISFLIIRLAPGNPISLKIQAAEGIKAEAASPEIIEKMQKLYGLKIELPAAYERQIHRLSLAVHGSDDPAHPTLTRRSLSFLGQSGIQYWLWLKRIASLNFGESFKDHRPVIEKIREALPITLALNLIEIVIVYFISIPLGVFSALNRESSVDKAVMVVLFILYSLPTFWVATLLIKYFAGGDYLNWFPLFGIMTDGAEHYPFFMKLGNVLWHLVLPVTAMVYGSFAFLTRFSRSTMLEVVKQDYVRTAMAKGLPKRKVVWHHAFRNQLIPLITLLGTLLPALLGGSVIIEQIFSIPGMGKLAFESVLARDYPTIMAIATISAVLTLVSLLLSDLAYVWADPRISFESRG
ncbi:MAG TPA: diguanylate cyclase [Deltaproteobacteria bacterium]|nr:diguanylate cyclase [Deltaproteobacteria bacterium]